MNTTSYCSCNTLPCLPNESCSTYPLPLSLSPYPMPRLWLLQWASIYNDESQSHELLYNIHDTFFLVNVVDNNFIR